MKDKKILIACEESQRVCIEFRKLGYEAYSCDIQECSGGHPEWHIKGDALQSIRGGYMTTCDGQQHYIDQWDLIIAHPPCTYLTVTGNRHFNVERYGNKAIERLNLRAEAAVFFMQFAAADCKHIAIENPIGWMNTHYRKPDQIIQPWQFGDNAIKHTCLWLKGLPDLIPSVTEKPAIEYHEWITKDGKKKRQEMWYYKTRCLPKSEKAKAASKTFPGIACAMAAQWAQYLESEKGS